MSSNMSIFGYKRKDRSSANAICQALLSSEVVWRVTKTGGDKTVSEGKGRLYKRRDDKYLVYLPKDLAEDSMFPWKDEDSVFVKISFELGAKKKKLLIETWEEPEPEKG